MSQDDPTLRNYLDDVRSVALNLNHKEIISLAQELERRLLATWNELLEHVDEAQIRTVQREIGINLTDPGLHGDQLESIVGYLRVSPYRSDRYLWRKLIPAWCKVVATRDEILRAALPLVVYYAKKYQRRGTLGLSDLIQEGNIGLIKAAYRFEWRKGWRFSTYCTWWIKHSIRRAIDDAGLEIRIPVCQLEKARREGRAASMGLVVTSELPLDAADDAPSPEEQLAAEQLKNQLGKVLHVLTARERHVIRAKYFEEKTLADTGAEMGLSRERARQIEAMALAKLRAALAD